VAEVIEDVADISRDEINMDSSLMDDLELSSLELMTIFSDISRKTSVQISNNDILKFETVADIVAVLDAHS
jgi:acyl carrier protein